MEGQEGWAQLTNATQPLEGPRFDQIHGQGFGRQGTIQADRPMQRVVVGAAGHAVSICAFRIRWASSSQASPSPPGFRGSGSARR